MLHGLSATLDRLNLSQVDFAKGVGVREETVSRWVRGRKTPGGDSLAAVLTFLKTLDPNVTYEGLSGAPGSQIPLPVPYARGRKPIPPAGPEPAQ